MEMKHCIIYIYYFKVKLSKYSQTGSTLSLILSIMSKTGTQAILFIQHT